MPRLPCKPIVFVESPLLWLFSGTGRSPKVLEAAVWRLNSVFASFYFKYISYVFEGLRSLGPFVAAGNVVDPT